MDCREVERFLYAYLDGEFNEEERVVITAHVQSCPGCKRLVSHEERFLRKLRQTAADEPAAPPLLAHKVRRALDRVEQSGDVPQPEGWSARWFKLLVPVAVALALAVGVSFSSRQPQHASLASMAEQSVEWHRRNLPFDVSGPNADTIRNYFSDKVPFAVRPPQFDTARVELVGGRLSNLREHQAAYLVYQVGGRRVSVFIFDPRSMGSEGGQVVRVGRREVRWHNLRGYTVAMYRSGGMGYVLASDMEPERLQRLISVSR